MRSHSSNSSGGIQNGYRSLKTPSMSDNTQFNILNARGDIESSNSHQLKPTVMNAYSDVKQL